MDDSSTNLADRFSIIYMEEGTAAYPLAQRILARYPSSNVVTIRHFKDVFNRPRQDFQLQKRSPQLILAVKTEPLMYTGSEQCQDFGMANFCYCNPVLNCIFNCHYCYLQGMYNSANPVVFVNTDAFFESCNEAIACRRDKSQPVYLCISYDTDLLAFESLTGLCSEWAEFAAESEDLLIELRTKTASYSQMRHVAPTQNMILAWSLSPAIVQERFEPGTPSLRKRLESASKALQAGWPVRLCFDPLLPMHDWQEHYGDMIDQCFETLPAEEVRDVALGAFRMGRTYFERLRKRRRGSEIAYLVVEKDSETVTLPSTVREEMVGFLTERLVCHLPNERIEVWK